VSILIFTFDMRKHCKTVVLLYVLVRCVSCLTMAVEPKHVAATRVGTFIVATIYLQLIQN